METVLLITRFKSSSDAYFSRIALNGEFVGYGMERIAVAILEGRYVASLELSPHFGFLTPHLNVAGRTYIEVHPANYPSQLEGCIAVGQSIDGDALDNSKAAFDLLMSKLPQYLTVEVCTGE